MNIESEGYTIFFLNLIISPAIYYINKLYEVYNLRRKQKSVQDMHISIQAHFLSLKSLCVPNVHFSRSELISLLI